MRKLLILLPLTVAIVCTMNLLGCKKNNPCNCEVTYQTTKSGKWKTESTRTVQEFHDGKCNDGDRTEVIVWPTSINTTAGSTMTTNGIREIYDCK
ncbi:MAG: hypothetical protein RL059_1055 [Bacteroidota bacterium]|jgi:hypothetical protein